MSESLMVLLWALGTVGVVLAATTVGCLYWLTKAVLAYVGLQIQMYQEGKQAKEDAASHAKAMLDEVRKAREEMTKNPPPEVFGKRMEANQIKRTIPVQ